MQLACKTYMYTHTHIQFSLLFECGHGKGEFGYGKLQRRSSLRNLLLLLLYWRWSRWLPGCHAPLSRPLPLVNEPKLDQSGEEFGRVAPTPCISCHPSQPHFHTLMQYTMVAYAYVVSSYKCSMCSMINCTLHNVLYT